MRLYYSLFKQAFELQPYLSNTAWILPIYISVTTILQFQPHSRTIIPVSHYKYDLIFPISSSRVSIYSQLFMIINSGLFVRQRYYPNCREYSLHLQRNQMLLPELSVIGSKLAQLLGKCALILVLLPIIVSASQSLKIFSEYFSQTTTTSSKILHIGDTSVTIFNPENLKIGIFKFGTTSTSNFITITPNATNYLQGNFLFNKFGAMGITNLELYTLIGDTFYDGLAYTFAGAPKMWRVVGGEYVAKLMPDNMLYLTHWKNIKYIKLCNVSNLNVSSALTDLSGSRKEQLFLFYANTQVVRLVYNETIDNYTSQTASMPSNVANISNFVLSSDGSCFYYHHNASPNQLRIHKFLINKEVLGFSLSQNVTLNTAQNISKISYSENNLNFILLLSNSSFRVCGFNWQNCYHLVGAPVEQITPQMEQSRYLVKDFILKNLTNFGVMTFTNQFKLYNTSEFQASSFIAEQQWPDGVLDSDPLSETQKILNETAPDYQYPVLEIDEQEEDFAHLSSSTVALVYLISLPQSRKVLVFLNPLYMLLQNFWLYNYQNTTFRPVVNRTLSIMRVINQVKLFPLPLYSVENVLKSKVNFNKVTDTDFTPISPVRFVQIEGNDVSFLKNIQDSFIWGSIYTILSIVFTKILSNLPFKSKAIKQFLKNKSHNGVVFTGLIQSNIQFYAFMGFSQLRLTGQLEWGDKAKLASTVFILFVVIFYCIAAFMIVAGLFRKCWSVFIEDRQQGSLRSVYFSVIWLTLQNLLIGLVNGFFQENASLLQLMIITIDALSLACVLFFWSTAQSYVSNILLTLYLVFKLLFDIVIYETDANQWMESILIAAIILTILYSVFWNISLTYKDSCQIFIEINKNSHVNITSKQLAPPQSKQEKSPAQALESQIIFNTNNKIESSVALRDNPKSVVRFQGRKSKPVQKTQQFLNKIANTKNHLKDPEPNFKKPILKKTFGESKTLKSLKKNKGKLESCVSGKISTFGEIQLYGPSKCE